MAIHKYLDKRKTEGKNPRMTYFFDVENVRDVLIKRVVIKKEQKRKPTQKH